LPPSPPVADCSTAAPRPLLHFFLFCAGPLPDPPSFPTRRSSDLFVVAAGVCLAVLSGLLWRNGGLPRSLQSAWNLSDWQPWKPPDRKSTRLNSSHQIISYAVFCLKKKTTRRARDARLQRRPELRD